MSSTSALHKYKESLFFLQDPLELHLFRIYSHIQSPVGGSTRNQHPNRKNYSTINGFVGLSIPLYFIYNMDIQSLSYWAMLQLGAVIFDLYVRPSILPELPPLFEDNYLDSREWSSPEPMQHDSEQVLNADRSRSQHINPMGVST